MSWLLIAIIAYLILAFVNLADKFIIEKVIPGPKTYTFLVGVTGALVIIAAPWFLIWPGWALFFFNCLVGSFFAGGLFFLYSALKGGEASRIFTLVGGMVPIFTVLISLAVFGEVFSTNQWLALVFLILGTVVISSISVHHNIWFNVRKFLGILDSSKWPSIIASIIAALFFALFWIGSKQVYNTQEFVSGFIWVRLGTFLTVLFLLIRKSSREEILAEIKNGNKQKNNRFVYLGTQGLAALGSILQNYAVALGSVALVTSLQGLQYALLLVLSAIVTFFFPKIIKEEYNKKRLIKKITAIVLIMFGLYFLAI
ncbi:MAG: EamA family transporter [Candidatus Komeilibacteria bacterium]|jgi:drug/metabolite transporter (DMT)-like permease|nr:EamA family transporter [Candidatus Komeilibacteria bacterium]